MQFLTIATDNTVTVGLPVHLMAAAMKAMEARRFYWDDAEGYTLIAGDFLRPFPVAVCRDSGHRYGIVPLSRGLSTRLLRPAVSGGTAPRPFDFGLTPRGELRHGPSGTVTFEDADPPAVPPEVRRWLDHGERGLSSEALCRAIYGVPAVKDHFDEWSHPLDPDDLRRALLFLDNCTDARNHLDRVAGHSPQWAALVEHWDELESLMREEAQTGRCPKTYGRMKALLASAVGPAAVAREPLRRAAAKTHPDRCQH